MSEVWKDVPGYEGVYQVSDMGNVKSLPRVRIYKDGTLAFHSERALKPRQTPNGYLHVSLYKDGQAHQTSVHRIVMLAFVGPSNLQVNHINEVKTDNRLENLEYMTGLENTRYTCRKPVESYDLKTGKTIKQYESMRDARADGHDSGAISSVCLNKYGFRSHHGLGWRFQDVKHSRANSPVRRADSDGR